MAKRLQAMGVNDYRDGFNFKIIPDRLDVPLKTKKPTKFFVNSMSDLWHEKMPECFLDKIFNVIKETPHHTYQILTKRAERMSDYFKRHPDIPENVWLGVTVENRSVKNRIDHLRKTSAHIKFLSIEPLLEDIKDLNLKNIDWVIVGGESGFNARPMRSDWVIKIKDQCKKQNVAFFFKQWGTWGADGKKRNKRVNGRRLQNRVWSEYPDVIKATSQKKGV